jgi:uncharacterized protein (DUF608 family)
MPFVITWYFPNRQNNWVDREEHGRGQIVRNWYARHFGDAWDVGRYVVANLDRLRRETRCFHNALFDSTLPAHVLEAVSSQISTLHTNTLFRSADGHVFGFEGCGETSGCCPMNCTHVWNYAQAMAWLFPSLERTMREIDLLFNTDECGDMAFRTLVPLGPRWKFKPAADGQMGTVMRAYREWQMCGDDIWLGKLWPSIKRALEFAWQHWDADQDGVMEGEQHNTYDIEFDGPNTMMGTWYLGALRAAEEMARAMGEPDTAEKYHALFEEGSRSYDELCWNGEYYVQRVPSIEDISDLAQREEGLRGSAVRRGENQPRYQYGGGCLSNQLVGQFAAMVYGLGYLLPPEHVRQALQAVFRHNWRPCFFEHTSFERAFAINDDAGLVDCSWPYGDRPTLAFPSADGPLTGYEYQAASLMLYEGLFEEGFTIIRAVRERHDGERRNPWNEFECGDHYCRGMSNWAVLLALSGYQYSAPKGRLRLAPRFKPQAFKSFWSAGTAWGSFEQQANDQKQTMVLSVRYGELFLQILELSWVGSSPPDALNVTLQVDGGNVQASVGTEGSAIELTFPRGIRVGAGQQFVVTLSAQA